MRRHGQAPNIDSVLHGWQSCPVHVVESDVSISDDERSEGFFYYPDQKRDFAMRNP